MEDEFPDYIDAVDLDVDVSDTLSSLAELEDREIGRLRKKLEDVESQLEEERKVLEENIEMIYRQIEEVQDQLRELDTPGYKPDSDIRKERELRKRLEDLYGDIRRDRREWRRDRQKPLQEKRELEELLAELNDSQQLQELL